MNRSAKGSYNERRSMDFLNELDYYTTRSAGSHGAIDVIGVYNGKHPMNNPLIRLVQSKTHGGYSETSIVTLRMIITMLIRNATEISDEIVKHVDPILAYQIINHLKPVVELHNWEKFRRRPSITLLGRDKSEDIDIIE